MARFKQMPQKYLMQKLFFFWGNMVRNYQEDVIDDDFFDVVRNGYDHDRAVELIESSFTDKELDEMKKARSRNCRLDFSDSLDDIFKAIWNNAHHRERCRNILELIEIRMRQGSYPDRKESIEKRFEAVQRLLKLTDLELDILILAYVKSETCFDWPCRVEDREKPFYYAMALDRSNAEVSKAMSATGTLRKYGLLDNSWDFNLRAIGGYMDGTDDEAFERRFYKKSEEKDILPWDFYGDLSAKDGETIKEIIKASEGRCNILLYGALGTGKTSFASESLPEIACCFRRTHAAVIKGLVRRGRFASTVIPTAFPLMSSIVAQKPSSTSVRVE